MSVTLTQQVPAFRMDDATLERLWSALEAKCGWRTTASRPTRIAAPGSRRSEHVASLHRETVTGSRTPSDYRKRSEGGDTTVH